MNDLAATMMRLESRLGKAVDNGERSFRLHPVPVEHAAAVREYCTDHGWRAVNVGLVSDILMMEIVKV